jgi:hypothetical protein
MENKISYLESMLPNRLEVEKREWPIFKKEAKFFSAGLYLWRGAMSANNRELFLMGCLVGEGIKFENK